MPTILDIAKKANVSKSTVSRVINNHPYVSESKRQKVLNAIEELNYSPNAIAKQFRFMGTKTIAVSIPELYSPFFSLLASGISRELQSLGYKAMIIETFFEKSREKDILEMLKHKEVEGVILCSVENQWELIKGYLDYGTIVICNESEDEASVPIICYDERSATIKGIEHFVRSGHLKIGFCYENENSSLQRIRLESYKMVLNKHQLAFREEWVFNKCYSIEDGIEVGKKLLQLPATNRPDAIFTGNDYVAAGIIKELGTHNIKIPDDIAVIGFDDHPICLVTTPTITTIRIPIKELGIFAAKATVEGCLTDNTLLSEIKTFDSELIIREST